MVYLRVSHDSKHRRMCSRRADLKRLTATKDRVDYNNRAPAEEMAN